MFLTFAKSGNHVKEGFSLKRYFWLFGDVITAELDIKAIAAMASYII